MAHCKILIPLFITLLLHTNLEAQTKGKPAKTVGTPSQKELDDLMKQAQQLMKDVDPATRKLMDSLGINMPSDAKTPKLTASQWGKANADASSVVPKKDPARIASIARTPVDQASIISFVAGIHAKLSGRLPKSLVSDGDDLRKKLDAAYHDPRAQANAAASLWAFGHPGLAVYLMGMACQASPKDLNSLSNYAAMLTMLDGPEYAIPILNYVQARLPSNSTVLNNLGQAWFRLGDLQHAKQELDSCIRFCAWHPQANGSLACIYQSTGDKAAAVQAMQRATQGGWSMDKADRLRSLGHRPDARDIRFPLPKDVDPLGLHKFVHPPIPFSVEESKALEPIWSEFRANLQERINMIGEKKKKLEAGMKMPMLSSAPIFAEKVALVLAANESNDRLTDKQLKWGTEMADIMRAQGDLTAAYEELLNHQNDYDCPAFKAASDKYVAAHNNLMAAAWEEHLRTTMRDLNTILYYQQFILGPQQFEQLKYDTQIAWLRELDAPGIEFITNISCASPRSPKHKGALPDFDEVNCTMHSVFSTPVGRITLDCVSMTTELDLRFVKATLVQDQRVRHDENDWFDQFKSGSIAFGAGVSLTDVGFGTAQDIVENMAPLKAEISAGGFAVLEFDRNGLSDVALEGSVTATLLETNVPGNVGTKHYDGKNPMGSTVKDGTGSDVNYGINDLSLDIGVTGRVSIMSGWKVEPTGLLTNLK